MRGATMIEIHRGSDAWHAIANAILTSDKLSIVDCDVAGIKVKAGEGMWAAPLNTRRGEPRTIRMVRKVDGPQYREVSESEFARREAGLTFEGVDGDELANTVTYWYAPDKGEED